LNKIF
jgi:hypothetical protein